MRELVLAWFAMLVRARARMPLNGARAHARARTKYFLLVRAHGHTLASNISKRAHAPALVHPRQTNVTLALPLDANL